jgi:DnaK suppressor protein
MTRDEAFFKLNGRLIARRDALRKTLNGELDGFQRTSETSGVGDQVDTAVRVLRRSRSRLLDQLIV